MMHETSNGAHMTFLPLLRSFLAVLGAFAIVLALVSVLERFAPSFYFENQTVYEFTREDIPHADTVKLYAAESVLEKEVIPDTPKSVEIKPPVVEETQKEIVKKQDGWEVARIQNPYGVPPRSFEIINAEARASLVNIFCQPFGSLSPITASGFFIDPRGIILTNAHVAQYVLLADSKKVDLRCFIRTGAPAQERWTPHILYIPPVWVREHAHELKDAHVLGTGEHDYGFLYVGESVDGSVIPQSFPFLLPDVRTAIGFTGDSVLAASYPAGFLGGMSASMNLYPASAITTIQSLMTFLSGSPDIFTIGGTVTAQSGSSGGVVANAWGRAIGLITTMSEGKTTSERTLRALTLSYIDADLVAQTGGTLADFLAGNHYQTATSFMEIEGGELADLLVNQIIK
ncbi:MAG TPA: serine protease [Candidatus Paceibacterota bacterium]